MFGFLLRKTRFFQLYWVVHYSFNNDFWWTCAPVSTLKEARSQAAYKKSINAKALTKIVLTIEFWPPPYTLKRLSK